MYGQDARLPTKTALSQPKTPYQVDIQDYRTELVSHLSDAWNLAQGNIAKAQTKQKRNYDRGSKELKLQKGDRVMVRMDARRCKRKVLEICTSIPWPL